MMVKWQVIFTESALRPIQSESCYVRPYVCVSEIYFEGLFAPTYESRRPNFFGFLDSLEKSHGKDVVSD